VSARLQLSPGSGFGPAGTVAVHPVKRRILQETLRSWLRNLGDRAVMLEELDLHPAG
jgi:hypothetical protein